jgi:Rps23 Pro-64 3,4-dihydroxylase Tpa1-like proline 4-hydroxylase
MKYENYHNLSLSNVQLLPELCQAIEQFAQEKNIKVQTAVIELISIGLEQVNRSNSSDLLFRDQINIERETLDLENIIQEITTEITNSNNFKIDSETIKQLTLEILKSQLQENSRVQDSVLSSSYLQINNFFGEDELINLVDYTLEKEAEFIPTSTSTNDSNYRQSKVWYNFPEFSNLITEKIKLILPEILEKLDISPFNITRIESQLTAHNDGNFYKIHNDNGSPDTANRVLTYVYYFYQEPKAFTGGELKIYDSKIENNFYVAADTYKIIEPINNSIVFFLSRYLHEVLPIKCPSHNFADSRFTINGWIWQ